MVKPLELLALGSTLVSASPFWQRAPHDAANATGIKPTGHLGSTGTGAPIIPLVTSTPSGKKNGTETKPTATALRPKETNVYEHSGFNTTLNPMFNATGNWTTMSCSDPYFSKINPNGVDLWTYAGADQALTQLLAAWNEPDRAKVFEGETFSRFVWTVFNVTGGNTEGSHADCSDVYDQVCSNPIPCEGIPPAGYLIINSMVMLNKIYQMQYNALQDAFSQMSDAMGLVVDNFDWQPKPSDTLTIIEDILGFASIALGAVGGAEISAALTAVKVFGEVTEAAANTIKTVASTGINLTNKILSSIPAPTQQSDILGDLNAILQFGKNGLGQAIESQLATLADANGQENQTLFQSFMNSGLLLDYGNANTNNTEYLSNVVIGMLYAEMIPAAWGLSVENLRPFILRMDARDGKCNGTLPSGMSQYFDKDVAQDALWCDEDGNSFWLLNGVSSDDGGALFKLLPGGNNTNLNGNGWGGITMGDIIRSSWGGFEANNKQNGYTIPQGTAAQVASNMTTMESEGLPMAGGILTPGLFNFTICLDYNEAVTTLTGGSDDSTPICGKQPAPGDSFTGMNNAGAYTPGWCKVHIDQYQRNEGNENPLNNYQLSVNIFDGASLLIGDGTKQSAAEPLAIVDSVLPYHLIVAPGAGDSDPVSFWYADQFWYSNSTGNQCSVGQYDSGMRQMDCGFNCPLPGSQPAVSATKAHPLPAAPTSAIGGTQVFANTYITPAPTPTAKGTSTGAAAKPTPTYATGWCGLHVRQYQRNEDGENPTNNYEIEATLYDAKQHVIGDSGQVPAPSGKPVTVNGLVDPFTVTAGAGDSDPLLFSYNGQNFNSSSSQCNCGKYDSGHRDMDCGFTC